MATGNLALVLAEASPFTRDDCSVEVVVTVRLAEWDRKARAWRGADWQVPGPRPRSSSKRRKAE